MKLKNLVKSREILLFFISFVLIMMALWVFRYIKVFGLDIYTGCETTRCHYGISFYGGVASYLQWEEDLLDKVIQAVGWSMDKKFGEGTFYIGWGSDGKAGTVCGEYVVSSIQYRYLREFEPTNIYTLRHNKFEFIDTCN